MLEKSVGFIKRNWKEKVLLFVFAILLTSCFFTFTNPLAENFLPSQEVSITVHKNANNNNVYIVDNGFCDIFRKDKLNKIISEGEWNFLDKADGYSFDMVYIGGDISNKKYTFDMKAAPNAKITFWGNIYGGQITIKADGIQKELNLFSDVEGGSLVEYFPFQDSHTLFFIKGVLFCISLIIVCTFLYIVGYVVKQKDYLQFLRKKAGWRLTLLLFFIFYLLDVVLYKNEMIANLLQFGDQLEYWLDLWNAGGKLSSAHEYIRVWNGYLCYYIPYICRRIGEIFNIDSLLIWFIVPSASASVMSGYSIPTIYEFCTKKQAQVWQVLLFSALYVFFWSGTLSAVLMDLVGVSCFLFANAMLIRFIAAAKQLHRIVYGALAGLFFSASISFRTVYLYSIPFLILFFLIIDTGNIRNLRKSDWLKKSFSGLVLLFFAFGMVCIPQFLINQNVGVNSPFPCANRKVWRNGIYDRSLSEYSMNASLGENFAGYPFGVADKHANSMKTDYYDTNSDSILTISQGLELFMSQPMDTIVYIVKKILIGFDAKTGVSYPDFTIEKSTKFYLFSFCNYFIFASALFSILNHKVNKKSGMLLAILFLMLILPHTWTHIEWRYYLIGYVIAYFLFCYFLCGNIGREEKEERIKYWAFVDVSIVFAFLISLDFYAKI